jgi:hypothetical protein
MTAFDGFSEEVFECCQPSEKIRKPINVLKQLRLEVEPELKKINTAIDGHVSRTKKKGTNEYYDWAWLYFNTIGTGAYRYSQLTVNISPDRLYVGMNLKTSLEKMTFRREIEKEENNALFEQILQTLSGREWIIPMGEYWEHQIPRRYSVEELRGTMLDPRFDWINACFEKGDPILKKRRIVTEIVRIFEELYNIYALSSGNKTTGQPKPKFGIFAQKVVIDSAESSTRSDKDVMTETKRFLSSLTTSEKRGEFYLPGKRDQYFIKRTALRLNLKDYRFDYGGRQIIIYADKDIEPFRDKVLDNYAEFSKTLNKINHLLFLPEGFLKVMFVDPKSDARYQKDGEDRSIFVNLARFKENSNLFFWLFTVSREIAYVRAHRLGYRFINELRNVLAFALTNFEISGKDTID